MTKAKYMALDDLQTVWDNSMKPYIQQQTGASPEPTSSAISMWNNYNIR